MDRKRDHQMMDEATPTDAPGHCFRNFSQARKWAKQNIAGCYKNNCTGMKITISGTAIDKYLSASAVLRSASIDAHLSALRVLPRMTVSAILKESQQDRDGNRDIKAILRFYASINYQSETYPVKITVKAYPGGINKAYSYEVLQKSPIIDDNHRDLGTEIQNGQREQYATSSPHPDISASKDITIFLNSPNK